MNRRFLNPLSLFAIIIALPSLALAADLTGTWKAEFETQIGVQKYTYILQQSGTSITGKANSDIGGEKHESDLKEGKIDGEKVAFVELFTFQGNEIRIVYTGKLSGDEIRFTREVGEFAKEELVAKRVLPPAPDNSKSAPKGP